MQEQIAQRLERLRQEQERGRVQLRLLIEEETGLREMLLRIDGAVQVLEELLAEDAGPVPVETDPPEPGTLLVVS